MQPPARDSIRIRPRALGLSLLECIVGLALLGGAVLVVMGLFPAAYSSMTQARETSAATQFASGLLDQCRSQSFYSVSSIPSGSVRFTNLVDGVPTRLVGRVAMDMLYVDLTPVPHAGVGSPVTLWGEGLPADTVAAAAGTVSYELFCALAARVPQEESN